MLLWAHSFIFFPSFSLSHLDCLSHILRLCHFIAHGSSNWVIILFYLSINWNVWMSVFFPLSLSLSKLYITWLLAKLFLFGCNFYPTNQLAIIKLVSISHLAFACALNGLLFFSSRINRKTVWTATIRSFACCYLYMSEPGSAKFSLFWSFVFVCVCVQFAYLFW